MVRMVKDSEYNGFEIFRDGMGQWAAMRASPRVQLGWTERRDELVEVIDNFVADHREFSRALDRLEKVLGVSVTAHHRHLARDMKMVENYVNEKEGPNVLKNFKKQSSKKKKHK